MKVIGIFLLKVIVPIVVVIASFKYNVLLGISLLFLYFVFIYYINQSKIFEVVGKFNYARGNTDIGLKWLERAYKSGKAAPYTIMTYAYLLLKQGCVQESANILSQLLNSKLKFEDEMVAKSNFALIFWKKGLLDDAVRILEEVFEKYKNTTIYGSLGYMLIAAGDTNRALKFNLEAYEYNDNNSIIIDNLAQTYFLMKEYEKAEELYKKLMTLNPSFPEAYYNYGLVLLQNGEKQEAYEMIKKALQYEFSYLSTVTKNEVENKLGEVESMLEV